MTKLVLNNWAQILSSRMNGHPNVDLWIYIGQIFACRGKIDSHAHRHGVRGISFSILPSFSIMFKFKRICACKKQFGTHRKLQNLFPFEKMTANMEVYLQNLNNRKSVGWPS